ncbi:MAG: phenylalanine--tRNA ligase subunit beta [Bryobacteraceae bacterium]
MKFSFNWIQELVDGLEISPRELEQLITIKTAECEGLEPVGEQLDRASAAKVLMAEPIPGSHNRKVVVQIERYGEKTVVCGAPNCRPGILTAYVPVGRKVIQGVESDGMLASGAELGLNRDASGILELSDGELARCLPDRIIEIDNKSITHRPDLWGHHGMAREVAAISRRPLRDPVRLDLLPGGPSPVEVAIEDLNLCPRYSALAFENVTVRPSPLWLQYRLQSLGLNPINNIVDFTNYVMAELAQPTHAFDRAKLKGNTIHIRPARAGERLMALNREEYELRDANLVIADAAGPIALAGVIGGLESAIDESTTSIVLESACFLAASVRKTSSQLKLRTDASMRFEKAQDPANTVRALARAVELLAELSPGIRLAGGVADRRKAEAGGPPREPILLPLDWLSRKLGRGLPAEEVRDILERLEFGVTPAGTVHPAFAVTVPSWRATKDISVKDDLVEEVGRMIGYDSIEPRPPSVACAPPPRNEVRLFHRNVRNLFTALGFTEVYNYSFVGGENAIRFGFEPASHVAVTNPIASDQSLLRKSLLPGVWSNIAENRKHFDIFRLFEIGKEIYPGGHEIAHLVAAIYDKESDGVAALFELKHAALSFLPEAEVWPCEALSYEHPARSGEVFWQGQAVGRLFELHPSIQPEGRAAALDLNLEAIQELDSRQRRYKALRRYPSSEFDLSVVAGERELAGDIRNKIEKFAGPLLQEILYLRQYSGPPLESGRKSISFRVRYGSDERTLSLGEVNEFRALIIEGMQNLGYDLRV